MQILTQNELDRLSPPERLSLTGQLWDSLESEQLLLTPAQKTELDQRLADLDPACCITWEKLKSDFGSRAR